MTILLLIVVDLFPCDLFKLCQVKLQPQFLKRVNLKGKKNKRKVECDPHFKPAFTVLTSEYNPTSPLC